MNNIRKISIVAVLVFLGNAVSSLAAGPKISDMVVGGNKHNLSSLNKNVLYKAAPPQSARDKNTEICVFCHTPHRAVPQTTLWNRSNSSVFFGHYSSATLVIRRTSAAQFGEPNGTSRLCLSCHDGVTAGGVPLGAILNGSPINMGANDRITGISLFTASKIKSGHHPVSFIYDDAVLRAIQSDVLKKTQNYQMPRIVKLDTANRMQCTTCHDPHQNQSTEDSYQVPPNEGRKIAPFWVYGANNNASLDHDAVCMDCHSIPTNPFPLQ
ncbi:cytochrome C [Geobacter pelophilus]|uniref:Cytochrome C n=1 Tax=Geoanaerobacter pelophilus TaxID=60036 RepID=A0AAW4KY20_9BACT|nr:cytochrome C [Geoanaerobacter pelophilus]MBT0662792.1 cytochrome C [Geoanaerobacter pelophilus]